MRLFVSHLFIRNRAICSVLLVTSLLFTACESDFNDPGAVTEDQVLGSADGLTGLAVGLQRRWSVGRQSPVYTTITGSGFTTGEFRLINPGNESENGLNLGRADLDGNNALIANIWEQSLLVRGEANSILESLDQVEDGGVRAGLEAYAAIFKALANGTLAQFFEQAPLTVQDDAPFVTREQVLQEAIEALQSAQQTLNATAVSPIFLSRTPGSIDLANTVNALLARYSLFVGNYQQAIDAATEVDLSATSTFSYDAVNTNPIAFVSILTNNVYQPVDLTLGLPEALQPDTTDQRLEFYFADTSPEENDFRAAAFFDNPTDAIPVYLPGEMLLIQAEAHARLGNLDEAVATLNQVLIKTPDEDPYGIGASLPSYDGPETQEAILEAIYQNRAVELFMSGLGLEDSRRFERPGPNATNPERNRNWYPYPNSERDNNENTPANPSI